MRARILYLVGHLRSGGLERQLYYLLRTMDRDLFAPAVVVWNFDERDVYVRRFRELGVPVYELDGGKSVVARLRALRVLAHTTHAEVVHSYTFYMNVAAEWAAIGSRRLAVGSLRSDFDWARRESGALLSCLSGSRPHDQICNSYSAARAISRSRSPFVPRRIHTVRNGVDLELFTYSPLREAAEPHIVGVGNLLPVKRWHLLLAAASELTRLRVPYRMTIVGDGPLRDALERKVVSLGVARSVRLAGYCDDVASLIAEATVLVHAAEAEGCPNAVMEAMACGRPVVAMNAGDIPWIVRDGETGFVVENGDSVALVNRVRRLIQTPGLARQMGDAGRRLAEKEFSLDRLVSGTLSVYERAGWKAA